MEKQGKKGGAAGPARTAVSIVVGSGRKAIPFDEHITGNREPQSYRG